MEYRVERWKRKQSRGVHTLERQQHRGTDRREEAIMRARDVTKSHVWVCDSPAARVCVDVCCPSYHQMHSRCLRSGLVPETMWISEGRAAAGVHAELSNDLCCHLRSWGHPGPGCCWGAMSEFLVLWQRESALMSQTHVTTKAIQMSLVLTATWRHCAELASPPTWLAQ